MTKPQKSHLKLLFPFSYWFKKVYIQCCLPKNSNFKVSWQNVICNNIFKLLASRSAPYLLWQIRPHEQFPCWRQYIQLDQPHRQDQQWWQEMEPCQLAPGWCQCLGRLRLMLFVCPLIECTRPELWMKPRQAFQRWSENGNKYHIIGGSRYSSSSKWLESTAHYHPESF